MCACAMLTHEQLIEMELSVREWGWHVEAKRLKSRRADRHEQGLCCFQAACEVAKPLRDDVCSRQFGGVHLMKSMGGHSAGHATAFHD